MENSMSLYKSFCKSGRYDDGFTRLDHVDALVHCISQEILQKPYAIQNSPFLKEALLLLKDYDRSNPFASYRYGFCVSLWDAFYLVRELKNSLQDQEYQVKTSGERKYISHMFQSCSFQGSRENELTKLWKNMKTITDLLEMKKAEAEQRAEEEKKIEAEQKAEREKKVEAEQRAETEKKTEAEHKTDLSQEKDWHSSMKELNQQLLQIQPMVSESLARIMNFSENFTNHYVLQFAKMQIELYNLIEDVYQHHSEMARRSGETEYIHAVSNYRSFQNVIIEHLEAFGVEEISSEAGGPFQRKIHEVKNKDNFSPRFSVVKQSIRKGFRYGELVLQKEQIGVEDSAGGSGSFLSEDQMQNNDRRSQ